MSKSEAGRERQIPALVELPLPRDCPHKEILYWHTLPSPHNRWDYPPDATSDSVTLHKASRLITFSMWIPVRFFVTGPAGTRAVKPDQDDAEEAMLLAYINLSAADREGKVGKEVSVKVVLSDAKKQLYVLMQHSWQRHVQEVWEDQEGRVW